MAGIANKIFFNSFFLKGEVKTRLLRRYSPRNDNHLELASYRNHFALPQVLRTAKFINMILNYARHETAYWTLSHRRWCCARHETVCWTLLHRRWCSPHGKVC